MMCGIVTVRFVSRLGAQKASVMRTDVSGTARLGESFACLAGCPRGITVTWATNARISRLRMNRILLRIALVVAVSAVGAAWTARAGARQPSDGDVLVRIETTLGNIDIAVDTKHAP